MNRVEWLGITIALSIAALTLTALLSGIIITETNNGEKVFNIAKKTIEVIANIASIIAIIMAFIAYKNWRKQLETTRTIESIEIAKESIKKTEKNLNNNIFTIGECDLSEEKSINNTIKSLKKIRKIYFNIYKNQNIDYNKAIIIKEVRKYLMQIRAFNMDKALMCDWHIIKLERIKNDIETTGGLNNKVLSKEMVDECKIMIEKGSKDFSFLSTTDSILSDINLKL